MGDGDVQEEDDDDWLGWMGLDWIGLGWLVDWLVGWLIDGLIGWLIDWLMIDDADDADDDDDGGDDGDDGDGGGDDDEAAMCWGWPWKVLMMVMQDILISYKC